MRTVVWLLTCLASLIVVGGCASVAPRDYYFSARGDDRAGGTLARPLHSISRANQLTLHPGDRLLFEGGATFDGNLALDDHDAGAPDRPIRIASYGPGLATLRAGEATGIRVRNAAGIAIERLAIAGAGRDVNLGSGIQFVNEHPGRGHRLPFVLIKDVIVHGFGLEGIHVDAAAQSGFEDVRIENCLAYDNARCGIYVSGPRDRSGAYPHANVYIGHCSARDNPGDADARDENRTGSGIFLNGVDGATVEFCDASGNGRLCRASKGGPMGIWASESNRVVIQSCRSTGNRTGGAHDGGGFGLDGGMTNSILQYNYSSDNDGSGYGLFEYFGARPWHGNTVRYNVSDNDGRKNGYAGIHVWNGSAPGDLRDAWIYHNSVRIDAAGSSFQRPRALWIQSDSTDLRVMNNVLVTAPGLDVIEIAPQQPGLRIAGNCYWSGRQAMRMVWDGAVYPSLPRWREASGQERQSGLENPPLFTDDASGIARFRFRPNSPLLNAAVPLPVNTGGRDVVGTSLPQGAGFDVGAWEMPAR